MKLQTVFDVLNENSPDLELNSFIACKTCLQYFEYESIFEETGNCIECHDDKVEV